MDPISAAALGVSLGGSLTSGIFGSQAVDARRQSGLEQLRRQDLQQDQTLGSATALAGASGVNITGPAGAGPTGSMAKYLGDMSQEFQRQHQFTLNQINQSSDLGQISNTLGFASNLGSSLFSFGKANNWWQGAPATPATPGGG